MRFKVNKRCPRCDFKMPITMQTCPRCQLNFSKFDNATNKGAKQAYAAGEADQVLLKKGYPSDVKKLTLVLLTIFLGFLGVHYYFVGRKKMGLVFTFFFLVGVTNAIITSLAKSFITTDAYQLFYMFVLGWGVILVMWIIDIIKVLIGKFKIPVSVER